MVLNKHLTSLLFLILFMSSFLIIKAEQQNNNTKINYSNYDWEDDEEEEERKKGKNETHILVLNDSNYSIEIPKYDEALFLIFLPSPCENCKMYMPYYIRMSHYSYDYNMGIKFAKVDGTHNEKIVKEYNIESFPSVILFYQKKLYYYTHEISIEGLLKFYKKTKEGPIRQITNIPDFEVVLKAHMKVLLSTIKDQSLLIYKSLLKYSSENGDIEFISCTSDDCIKKYGKDDIIFFHEGEDKINYYSKEYEPISKANIDSIKNFLGVFNVEYGTLLNMRSKLNILFENDNKKAVFYFRNGEKEKYTSKDIIFREIGKELRMQNIYTYTSDISGDDLFESMADFFVISENELPTIIFYDLVDKKDDSNTYRIMNVKEKNINKKYILNFIEQARTGKIKRDLHTSFPPQFKEKDGLRNVVGRSYDKDVIEEQKNVCILFVDGKIESENKKKYKDILIDLSEKYSDDENMNIVFELIDGRKNEPRDIVIKSVEEFPLIYLYTNAKKEKKVIKFIPKNANSVTKIEVEDFIANNLGYVIDTNKNDL